KQAQAIAYAGFPGTLLAGGVDQPIAICEESILNDDGDYDCSIGRMINSGQNIENAESGGWTSFNQNNPCEGGTNAQEVNSLVCGTGNPEPLQSGKNMATSGGQIQSAFNTLISCWEDYVNDHVGEDQLWSLTLPVITCPGNNVGPCEELRGAVSVDVVWITGAGGDPSYSKVPTSHAGWDGSAIADGELRWGDFVSHFNLKNVGNEDAPYQKKSIYFKPECGAQPVGGTGGDNFGILAEIPVLVD
ncbi:MAG: pilus assembly protein TadG-related protein, partial [Planctomycetota bacterium]